MNRSMNPGESPPSSGFRLPSRKAVRKPEVAHSPSRKVLLDARVARIPVDAKLLKHLSGDRTETLMEEPARVRF